MHDSTSLISSDDPFVTCWEKRTQVGTMSYDMLLRIHRRHRYARYVCNLDNPRASRPTIYVGGYCKEYTKSKRPVGVMLDDTRFLR
jgi:hypothetical protein